MAISPDLPPLIGRSRSFLDLVEQVSRAAPLDRPVLVIGERGTGKELIAARLHYLSGRWQRPFVKVNCAALPESLLEPELFGHEAGAFTGATRRRIGRFEMADGGSLFLDEIAEASLTTQEKILRVSEYGEFERVGSSTTLTADVRLIAATNLDLPAAADAGSFRHDLLDRLAFDVLTLPPLRARQDDIPVLAEHFGRAMAIELGWDRFAGFTPAATAQLLDHGWPGNVRELKNVVERAVYRAPAPDRPIADIILDPFASPYRPDAPFQPVSEGATAGAATGQGGQGEELPQGFAAAVASLERRLLTEALEAARYNQRAAAQLLELSYHQLRHLLKKHNINCRNTVHGVS
jgi:psp operon transcriptional activator